MSILAWSAIVYAVLVLPALVVFFIVLITERYSPDQPPYVKAGWACLEVPVSGWLLYPLLILGAALWELPQDLWEHIKGLWKSHD